MSKRVKHWRRKATERLTEAATHALARHKRARRTIIRTLFTRWLDPACTVTIEFDDHRFVVDPKDTAVSFELMSGKAWQRDELNRAIRILESTDAIKAGGHFVDVGANIGTQTVYSLLSGRFSRAVALEPEPHNFALLEQNIAINSMNERAICVSMAASDSAGALELCINPSNAGGHSVEAGRVDAPGDTLRIKANTVDAILADRGVAPADIGLVWIDVEGHELNVIEGMAGLRHESVPLVVEFDGARQGTAGTERLKALLLPNYTSMADLRAATDNGEPATFAIRELTARDRATDLLIY